MGASKVRPARPASIRSFWRNPPHQLNHPNLNPNPTQEAGLDAAPGAPRLPSPECSANATRGLHRRLRQLGAGSLRGGLAVLAGDEEEQRTLATRLGVEPAVRV